MQSLETDVFESRNASQAVLRRVRRINEHLELFGVERLSIIHFRRSVFRCAKCYVTMHILDAKCSEKVLSIWRELFLDRKNPMPAQKGVHFNLCIINVLYRNYKQFQLH